MKSLLAALLVAFPLLCSAACPEKPIVFAGLNWDSGEFITAVLRRLIEGGYGCRTETIPGNSITLEQAVADNEVQIFAEEWVGRGDVWKRAAAQGKVKAVGHPFIGAEEGWYVPDYVQELHEVKQLAEDRFVALFRDPEQPDHGRFLNCPSGWTCEGVNSAKLHAYGLDRRYVDFRPGTGPAMEAAIQAATLQHQPILFYAWSPSPIAGRLKMVKLAEPPWSEACWSDLTSAAGAHRQGCAAPEADVEYGVSIAFAEAAPEIIDLLAKATFPLDLLDAQLAARADAKISAEEQADKFIQEHADLWRGWVGADAARRIESGDKPVVEPAPGGFPASWVISIRQPVNAALDRLVARHGGAFHAIAQSMLVVITALDGALARLPWWLLLAAVTGLSWWGSRRVWLTLAVALMTLAFGVLGLWGLMLQTLSLMLLSCAVTIILGIPLGVLAAKSRLTRALLWPVLDVMQTMPGFVYLIPALMLFGLGKVPAMLATIIYAMPPMIRLTALGIEQVDPELREAAANVGARPWRVLLSVELPLALPSLLAGIHQAIMLALSMVVVASMIGARGLGEQVLNGIQTLDIGQGLEAGIGIVLLAVILDRVTQGIGVQR
jgi:glycine betaine/proline transport system substrate-binding protein